MTPFNANEAFTIAEYNPAWPDLFEREASAIRAALGQAVVEIEHIGSTSVPGLAAKPIIDLLVMVESFAPLPTYAAQLAPLGYTHQPHVNDLERLFFWKGTPRAYHLHLVEYATWECQRHLLFRDYLRAHPPVAAQYEALKRELAERYKHDRLAYTDSKAVFICAVVDRAVAAIGAPRARRTPDVP